MTLDWSSSVSLPDDFEDALDHEHHVGAACVIFVEDQRHIVLVGPGQDALAELGHLLAVLEHDRILADEVDAADMAVEVDADAGPVEARRNLLDVRGLAGAMIAGHHDAAVVGKAGQDGERGLAIEEIVLVDIGDMLGPLRDRPALRDLSSNPKSCFTDTLMSGMPLASPFSFAVIGAGLLYEFSGRVLDGRAP